MIWAKPYLLNLLWMLIPLAAILYFNERRHKESFKRFVDEALQKDIAYTFDSSKRMLRHGILLGVIVFSIIALSRPQWGFHWQEIKREGLDVLLIVDTSKSMLTQDVKPNRLERTKLAVKDLLKKLKGDRIGLMAFAGDAFLVCPFTVDYSGFVLSLNDLDTNTVPRGGTNIGRSIEEAIRDYEKAVGQYKAIVIVTDGDNLEGDPLSWAKKAKEKGIKIYCIGIGTAEGELIQVTDNDGQKQFLKDDQGNFVKSRLNENLLQQIALQTGGVYVRSSGAEFGLDLIYDQELSRLEKKEIQSKMEKKYHERFQIPLGIALFLLVIHTCLGIRKRQS